MLTSHGCRSQIPDGDPGKQMGARKEPGSRACRVTSTAIPSADVLSLHAPLLPETRRMIGAAELSALPPSATLINTARGELVDPAALELACVRGLQAILDVTDPEPLPSSSPLYGLPHVVLTPHIAGISRRGDQADDCERAHRTRAVRGGVDAADVGDGRVPEGAGITRFRVSCGNRVTMPGSVLAGPFRLQGCLGRGCCARWPPRCCPGSGRLRQPAAKAAGAAEPSPAAKAPGRSS